MAFQLKVLFTAILVVAFLVIALFVRQGDKGTADAKYWRMGNDDSFRNMLLYRDGRTRWHLKLMIFALFVSMVASLWLIVP